MKRFLTSRLTIGVVLNAILILIISSCNKKPETATGTGLSDADSLKYLMYNIMQTSIVEGGRDKTTHIPLYYWYKDVPARDPLDRQFSNADTLLNWMKSFTRDNNGNILDRYSFIDDGSVVDQINGEGGDMGMDVGLVQDPDNNTIWLDVLWTDKNSPSGRAGVARGWQIDKINGKDVINANGNPNADLIINAIYGKDDQATFTFIDLQGVTHEIPLTKAEYNINPVLFDTVYNISGKNVGYFVFNSFTAIRDDNGAATATKNEIDRVFNEFSSKNISSLILDLRYNGGGDVATAEYIVNKIAPAALGGKEMYHYLYNDLLSPVAQSDGETTKVDFDGSGNLNLDHVFVIGTESTASASELTYNNLKAYMDVKLVGETTYGKPVGQWVWPISMLKNNQEQFLAYLIAITFETRNALDEGGYFQGIVPDKETRDYVDIPWGDPLDDNLENIFSFISTGAFSRKSVQERMQSKPGLKVSTRSDLPRLRFNGMIMNQKVKVNLPK